MKVMIWTSPWILQGGTVFFARNAFENHLLKQANTLARMGHDVSVIVPDAYFPLRSSVHDSIKCITLSVLDGINTVGGWSDPSRKLYEGDEVLCSNIKNWVRNYIDDYYDVILCWETPVPFLRALFPETLIVEQMPGGFARSPYPHTVTFDPSGLYKNSSLFLNQDKILSSAKKDNSFALNFKEQSRDSFSELVYLNKVDLRKLTKSERVCLLPLQISAHYAFQADTQYENQGQFIFDAINRIDSDVGIFITEYVARISSEITLSPEYLIYLQSLKANITYQEETRKISAISQHLMQSVNEIAVGTSGLALQALVWDLDIHSFGNTQYSFLDVDTGITNTQKDNILSFVLERNQPLAEAVTVDGKFLTALLEQMHKNRNSSTFEALPKYSDIDPNYEARVSSNFNTKEVKDFFVRKGVKTGKDKSDQFTSFLKEKTPELVSFDLFDTLVCRPFEQPADLYRLMEMKLAGTEHRTFNFAEKRLDAELKARSKAVSEEITLDDIYAEYKLLTGISDEKAVYLKDFEINIEIDASFPRKLGKKLWDIAVQYDAPIVITSDMYLPEEAVAAILKKNGYYQHECVYLSSDIGLTKKSGNLFDYILKERSVNSSSVVHIGDNERTDLKSAQDKKINAFHVPRAEIYLWEHPEYRKIFRGRKPIESLSRSVIGSLISKKLFDDPRNGCKTSLFNGKSENIGYCALGPLVLNFTLWLREQAINCGIKDLYFLSREGKILNTAFELLETLEPSGIRTNYLYASRRATRVPQIQSWEDIYEIYNAVIDQTATVERLIESRFGLLIDSDIVEKAKQVGLTRLSERISIRNSDRVLKLLKLIEDRILSNAKKERMNYCSYLDKMGFGSHGTPAVVDIGWNANMQGALYKLTDKKVGGFYVSTLDKANSWRFSGLQVSSFLYSFASITKGIPILENRLILEYLMCDSSASVERIDSNSTGEFFPVFVKNKEDSKRSNFIIDVHAGIEKFLTDSMKLHGHDLFNLPIDREISESILNLFLSKPTKDDARLLSGHSVEDNFSGASQVPILESNVRRACWNAGSAALKSDKERKRTQAQKTTRSLRARTVLSLFTPLLQRHLAPAQARQLIKDPDSYFENAKHPINVIIGRMAGIL